MAHDDDGDEDAHVAGIASCRQAVLKRLSSLSNSLPASLMVVVGVVAVVEQEWASALASPSSCVVDRWLCQAFGLCSAWQFSRTVTVTAAAAVAAGLAVVQQRSPHGRW